MKSKFKEQAIKLREKGYSYSEILREISIAKSTLSVWLRNVGLSQPQRQRLTEKKLAAMKRGWQSRQRQRILTTAKIKNEARQQVNRFNKRDLWLFGVALYWAEGHKERTKGSLVELGNSDPRLIRIFLKWLKEICVIPKKDIHFWLFIHETARERQIEIQKYWAKATSFPLGDFQKITWKKNNIKTIRKNTGENYYGLLRVIVRRSTSLNRKIQGWTEGVCKICGIV